MWRPVRPSFQLAQVEPSRPSNISIGLRLGASKTCDQSERRTVQRLDGTVLQPAIVRFDGGDTHVDQQIESGSEGREAEIRRDLTGVEQAAVTLEHVRLLDHQLRHIPRALDGKPVPFTLASVSRSSERTQRIPVLYGPNNHL